MQSSRQPRTLVVQYYCHYSKLEPNMLSRLHRHLPGNRKVPGAVVNLDKNTGCLVSPKQVYPTKTVQKPKQEAKVLMELVCLRSACYTLAQF